MFGVADRDEGHVLPPGNCLVLAVEVGAAIERTREYEHRHRALGERAESAPMRLTYFRPERAHMAPTVTVVIILSVLGLGALLGMPADGMRPRDGLPIKPAPQCNP